MKENEKKEKEKKKITEKEFSQGAKLIEEGITTSSEYLLFLRIRRMIKEELKKEC